MTESGRLASGWKRARGVIAVLLVAVLTPALSQRAEARAPEPTPLDLVVAVDESASLSAKDMRSQREAAATVAQSGLNPRSRVTVLGFGSANQAGQQAVTQYCRPTVVRTREQLQYLSNCVKGLHRRTETEGSDTDHVAALSEALRVLRSGSPSRALKTVFLLTDGRMDVSDSPAYGDGDRDAEARRRLRQQLRTARSERVNIWPMGFGPAVDQASLEQFAKGGAQHGCDGRAESRPRARQVQNSRQVARSLVEAYAAASCFKVSPPAEGTLRPGRTLELPIAVPDIASEVTLTVAKGDPRVRVEFVDPKGQVAPESGAQGQSSFTRSGTNGTIGALRVTAPLPGTWRIRLTAPDGVTPLPVGAHAMYQGVIRSRLMVEPPTVRIGGQVIVRLSLVNGNGYFQDPKELRKLTFTVTATGAGLGSGRQMAIRDDGQAPDDAPGDGSYAGRFSAPSAPGRVTLTGRVAGAGLRSDGDPTATIDVTARPPEVQGTVTFRSDTTVQPGQAVRGTVLLRNSTSSTVRTRLTLRAPPQAQATLRKGRSLTVPPGASSHEFTVGFGGAALPGKAPVTFRLTGQADPAKVYLTKQTTMTVEEPPGRLERSLPWLIGLIALLLVGAVATGWKWRSSRRQSDVRGLRVSLRRNDKNYGELRASRVEWAGEFRFVIRDASTQAPHLDEPRSGEDAFVAWRTDGLISVRGPDGAEFQVATGTQSEPVEGGLCLVFQEGRSDPSARRPAAPEPDTSETDPSEHPNDMLL